MPFPPEVVKNDKSNIKEKACCSQCKIGELKWCHGWGVIHVVVVEEGYEWRGRVQGPSYLSQAFSQINSISKGNPSPSLAGARGNLLNVSPQPFPG